MSFIIFILLFIVVVYLIFKFIKKLVFAVITLVVFVFLIFGGVGGIVYMDLKQLSSQDDFNIDLVYREEATDNYILGASIPVRNQEVDVESVERISKADLEGLDTSEISDDDKRFVVVINDETFSSILTKDTYDLRDIDGLELESYEDYNLTLTKSEVLEIVKSEDGLDRLLDIIFEKNDVSGITKTLGKPALYDSIYKNLDERNLRFKEALFLFVLSDSASNERSVLTILDAYKNDEGVEVYPDRFTFKLVRLLPISTLKEYLPDFS